LGAKIKGGFRRFGVKKIDCPIVAQNPRDPENCFEIAVELTVSKKPASAFSVNVAEHGLEVSDTYDQSPF